MRQDLLPETYDLALVRVIQEGSEVTKAITKIQQYGLTATDPVTGISYDNLKDMLEEFNDLEHAMNTIREFHQRVHGVVIPMPDIPIKPVHLTPLSD